MPRCARCFGELAELAVFCPSCSQPHQPAFEQLLSQTIADRYQVYRRLGQGGLSAVFTALDLHTDQVVVIKFSDPSHLTKRELTYALDAEDARRYWAEMLERMRREAEALTPIRHPNIVQLYDTGTVTEELRFVVMEYLRGRSLRDELAARRQLPLAEALSHAISLADALREIHARGIIHRDLTPRNVMLCSEEASAPTLKLIDFGIAKFPQPPGAPPFTQHSILSGTVAYASPEQCQNQPLDQRTDLYSLGIVLYEMLTGERPFTGRTPTEIALNQIQQPPRPPRELVPELPLSLESILLRVLAKAPADRPANIAELAADLRAVAQRVVVALPEQNPAALTQIQPIAYSNSALPDQLEETVVAPRFLQAYGQSTAPERRTLAYALAALLLLSGTAWLAKDRLAKPASQLFMTSQLPAAQTSPLPQPSAAPEPTLPAPEAEIAELWPTASLPFRQSQLKAFSKFVPRVAQTKPTLPSLFNPATPLFAPLPVPVTREPQPFSLPEPLPLPGEMAQAHPSYTIETNKPASVEIGESRQRRRAGRILPEAPESEVATSDTAANQESWNAPADSAGADEPADQRPHDFVPRIIAWSGHVHGERLVKLEMPGTPGLVEIPRSFRHRVGIVEPPCLENRWRLVALRVFGRGEVSIRVRWWPK